MKTASFLLVSCICLIMGCSDASTEDAENTDTPTSTPAQTPAILAVPDCDPLSDYLNGFIHSVEASSDGSLLIAVGGQVVGLAGKVIRTDANQCVTDVVSSITWVHSARDRVIQGKRYTLVTETGDGLILLLDENYNTVSTVHALSDGSVLIYPNNADWITDDTVMVTDRDSNRVMEIALSGDILWQYGGEGVLLGPHSGRRLANGNTLISDSGNNRIVEVNRAGKTVWGYSGTLDWPRGVERLSNGNTLIVSSYEGVVLEVTSSGATVWKSPVYNLPYEAIVTKGGEVLMSVIDNVVAVGMEPDVNNGSFGDSYHGR